VVGQVRVQLCTDVEDQPQHSAPALLTFRIVQQNQSTGGRHVRGTGEFTADRIAPRSESLRGAYRLESDLRAGSCSLQRRHCGAEQLGSIWHRGHVPEGRSQRTGEGDRRAGRAWTTLSCRCPLWHQMRVLAGGAPSWRRQCVSTPPAREPTGRLPIGAAARGRMVDVASSVQSWDLSSVRRDLSDAPLLRAANAAGPAHTPVWFMRQAGRSLPEYRELREGVPMLRACLDADLLTEITLQPVTRHGVDAAILFSDIVVPLRAAGVDVDIVPGTGPVLAEPVRSRQQVAALPELVPEQLRPIADGIGSLITSLGSTPLIGFAGAPFTLASYLIEGGPSRDYRNTKALMRAEP